MSLRSWRPLWVVAGLGAGLLLAHAALVRTPLGRWVSSFGGIGVRWEDPYRALGSPEAFNGSLAGDRERVLLANAMAESERPIGLTANARIHGPGLLAHLRYETFDTDGRRLDQWDVRALVPPLPWFEYPRSPDTPLRDGCPSECHAGEARCALNLDRSGDPGISPEWVLRMTAGRTYSLGPTSFATQDLLDPKPRTLSVRTSRREGRDVTEPADVRVTLVEACAGRLRMGTATHLEFAPNAIVPVPTGFRTTQWVQLEGCGRLEPLPRREEPSPSPSSAPASGPEPPPSTSRPPAAPGPQVHAVVVRRARGSGIATLEVDESWFDKHPEGVEFALHALCRYEPDTQTWTRLPRPDHGWSWTIPGRKEVPAPAHGPRLQ